MYDSYIGSLIWFEILLHTGLPLMIPKVKSMH